jgi:hypothetical protein
MQGSEISWEGSGFTLSRATRNGSDNCFCRQSSDRSIAAVVRLLQMTPAAPQSIEELGIPPSLMQDLVLRFLREHGTGSLSMLRRGLKISYPVADAMFQQLRQQQWVDVRGTAGNDYIFSLTGSARQFTAERSEVCRYAGATPVPLNQYTEIVRSQRAIALPTIDTLREAYADLVLDDDTLDHLGPAVISGKPLFVYGPSGNGKTSIIERLPRIFKDSVLIPYAIEVDAHIISVFDPLVHHPLPGAVDTGLDERWVRCRRPCVMAAGELVPGMLNLRLDEHSGVYGAPLQLKANNGILLIDDFGRQAMSPRELLNRWILPLDRHVDYLSLQYGLTFQVPFELLLAFATNLDPAELADEAFLRRVPNKIYVAPVNDERFDEILRRTLQQLGLPFGADDAEYLRALCRKHNLAGLRACYPKDICEILAAMARYHGQPVRLSRQSISLAAETYFTRSANN